MQQWWTQSNTDRPLWVMHTRGDVPAPQAFFPTLHDRWFNIQKRLDYDELMIQNTQYHGENYPGVSAFLGPGSLALMLGSTPGLQWDTVWYHPSPRGLDMSLNSEYWEWTLNFTRRALERAQGRYAVEMPDLIENTDVLASLLGIEPMLVGMLEEPDEIHRMQQDLLNAWLRAFDELYDIIKDASGNMSYGGMHLCAPGKTSKLQCDNAVMLSKTQFDAFVAPYLARQAEAIGYALYHFDGPNALQHTDTVLDIKALKAIQWQPGAAYPDGADPTWYDLQRRILKSGKSVMVFMKVGDPNTLHRRLEAFIKNIGKRGVMVVVEESVEPALAEKIINDSYKW
jgi:hypothetical protein